MFDKKQEEKMRKALEKALKTSDKIQEKSIKVVRKNT